MQRYVLALEGGDGCGKSTAVLQLSSLCRSRGISYRCIDRGGPAVPARIEALTRICHKHYGEYSKEADLLIRLARDLERAYEAAAVPEGLVILDRFVLSIYTRALIDKINVGPIEQLCRLAVSIACLNATIFVTCPFETAWERVHQTARHGVQPLSPKELRGPEFNRVFLAQQRMAFETVEIVGTRLELDNSGTEAELEVALCELLGPTLLRLNSFGGLTQRERISD